MDALFTASICSVICGVDDPRPYLYNHTTAESVVDGGPGQRRWWVLTTTVEQIVTDDERREARSRGSHLIDALLTEANRLATYQCERLVSGLFGVIPTVGTKDRAYGLVYEQSTATH